MERNLIIASIATNVSGNHPLARHTNENTLERNHTSAGIVINVLVK